MSASINKECFLLRNFLTLLYIMASDLLFTYENQYLCSLQSFSGEISTFNPKILWCILISIVNRNCLIREISILLFLFPSWKIIFITTAITFILTAIIFARVVIIIIVIIILLHWPLISTIAIIFITNDQWLIILSFVFFLHCSLWQKILSYWKWTTFRRKQ